MESEKPEEMEGEKKEGRGTEKTVKNRRKGEVDKKMEGRETQRKKRELKR